MRFSTYGDSRRRGELNAVAGLAQSGRGAVGNLLMSGIVVDDPLAPEFAGGVEVELIAGPEGAGGSVAGRRGVEVVQPAPGM